MNQTIEDKAQASLGAIMGEVYFQNFSNKLFPLNVVQVARQIGLKCGFTDTACARLIQKGNERYIEVSSKESDNFKRFAVAHMVARHVLNFSDIEYTQHDAFSHKNTNAQHQQANAFALGLLLPEKELRRVVNSGVMKNAAQLSQTFGVSQVAMAQRLSQLGLI